MTAETLQNLPVGLYWVWAAALAQATLIALPLTIYFLRRALKTARRLQHDLKAVADAGEHLAQLSSSLSMSIGSIDMPALVQLADSLHKPPVQVERMSAGLVHAGNGKNQGGIS